MRWPICGGVPGWRQGSTSSTDATSSTSGALWAKVMVAATGPDGGGGVSAHAASRPLKSSAATALRGLKLFRVELICAAAELTSHLYAAIIRVHAGHFVRAESFEHTLNVIVRTPA